VKGFALRTTNAFIKPILLAVVMKELELQLIIHLFNCYYHTKIKQSWNVIDDEVFLSMAVTEITACQENKVEI